MNEEDEKYARFGRAVAELLASSEEWNSDTLSQIVQLAIANGIDPPGIADGG